MARTKYESPLKLWRGKIGIPGEGRVPSQVSCKDETWKMWN